MGSMMKVSCKFSFKKDVAKDNYSDKFISNIYTHYYQISEVSCSASGGSDVVITCEGIGPDTSLECSYNSGFFHTCNYYYFAACIVLEVSM